MKLAIDDMIEEFKVLPRRLEVEGSRIVGVEEADLILGGEGFGRGKRGMRSGVLFPSCTLEALGLSSSPSRSDFYLSRWWSPRVGFLDQTFVGLPLPKELGTLGWWSTTLHKSGLYRPELSELLRAMGHEGFLSLCLSSQDGGLVQVQTGVPSWGLQAISEGCPEGLASFLAEPELTTILESPSLAIALFARDAVTSEPQKLEGLTKNVERHFWLGPHLKVKNGLWTTTRVVGVASSWGKSFRECEDRVRTTVENLGFSLPSVVRELEPTIQRVRRLGY